MRKHTCNALLSIEANNILSNLLSLQDNLKYISNLGIECIINSMKQFPNNRELLTKAISSLSSLARNKKNKSFIKNKGGLDCIKKAKQQFSDDSLLTFYAETAVVRLESGIFSSLCPSSISSFSF